MDKAKKTFVINVLRRGSYRWHGRWRALQKHKLGRNEYFCAHCGVIGGKKNYQLDHIEPVIAVNKTTDTMTLDEIADRMYCDVDGFQLLCKPCHTVKSQGENALRPEAKKQGKQKRKRLTKRRK